MPAVQSVALSATETKKSKYRPEIDGLRAFAVVAVIINHFNKDLLPSGYLGVDIFFVISGYVITSSLSGRESKNFLDFVTGFYERRIKRLVPALAVFVLITSFLISLFNPDPGVALGLGWRSLFGFSNITLFRSATDYFAESTDLNPFTHTWSLGVEEQFYLLFPFLIWFSGFGQQKARGARNLFFWVGTLTIASLISFIYLYQINQPAAYFLMPPRFWEMAAGCLIFIGFQKRAKIEQALEQVPPLLVVAAMVGVMLLPTAAAVPATISIVVLSAILVACLKKGTAAYEFFTLEKVVYVGLISYSLYLWHWTILSLSRWTVGISPLTCPLQISLIFFSAWASYRFIEKPARTRTLKSRRLSIVMGLIIVIVSAVSLRLGAPTMFGRLYTGRRIDLAMSLIPSPSENTPLQVDRGTHRQKLIVLGNSHANHLLPLASKISEKYRLSYSIIGTAYKPIPTIEGDWIQVKKGLNYRLELDKEKIALRSKAVNLTPTAQIDKEVADAFEALRRDDLLILSSRHFALYKNYFVHNGSRYFQLSRGVRGEIVEDASLTKLWTEKMQALINIAKDKGVNIVFFDSIPEFESDLKESALCSRQWFRQKTPDGCFLQAQRKTLITDRFVQKTAESLKSLEINNPNFYVFRPFDVLCPADQVYCYSSDSAGRLFGDNDHLSVRGSLLVAKHFEKFLVDRALL